MLDFKDKFILVILDIIHCLSLIALLVFRNKKMLNLISEYIFTYICSVKLKDEEKIRAIYTATLRLFESQGIAGINMANVAKEAGIATGTVYIYFKSKEELLNILFKETKVRSAEKIAKSYSEKESVKIVFNRMWLHYFKFSLEHYSESLFHEHFSISPLLSKENKKLSDEALAPIFNLIERAKKEKLVKSLDSMLLFFQIKGSMQSFTAAVKAGYIKPSKANVEHAMAMCWDSIKQ